MSRGLTPVDVQGLAGDERGLFEIQDRVDDVADLANSADGVKADHVFVGGRVVLRGLDDPRGDGVDSDAS